MSLMDQFEQMMQEREDRIAAARRGWLAFVHTEMAGSGRDLPVDAAELVACFDDPWFKEESDTPEAAAPLLEWARVQEPGGEPVPVLPTSQRKQPTKIR